MCIELCSDTFTVSGFVIRKSPQEYPEGCINAILPEVSVECYCDAKYDDCMDNIPIVPTGTGGGNLLGSRRTKYQTLDFLLAGSLGEE